MSYVKSMPVFGRVDGVESDVLRVHQVVQYIDLDTEVPAPKSICFLSFANDEGVRRNQGRIGAAGGSLAIRQAMASMPVHFDDEFRLYDCGVIRQDDQDLEKHQERLAHYVAKILNAGGLPVVLGGGHDITYGNYCGIRRHYKKEKIGIINFDAHLDFRPVEVGVGNSSGTSVWKIAHDAKENNDYFACLGVGIQKYGNTKKLFNLAKEFGVDYISGDEFCPENKHKILHKIQKFIDENDYIYFTICMDGFSASHAPGVSAPSLNGIIPDATFRAVFDAIAQSGKMISIDFAETNPLYDIDNRTSKLAASMIFRLF